MKNKVHFKDITALQKFVTDISEFKCDVNLYDNHNCLDAKSIMALMNLDLQKQFVVEVISGDNKELARMSEVLKEYEV